MADGKVVIDTALNNKGFERGVSGLKSSAGGLKSVLGGLGKTVAAAFSVVALVNFSKKAIELGSNVAEVQNVVDVAFRDMSYKIEDFAKTSIQNFGMSQLAAKKTASTYMAMARGMGVNEQAASDMAIGLTGLTGDVASFYNISQELADVKLKSVFTGETESLKDIGVVMTQTNLKAYALSQGITKNIESMSQGELVSLRYGFVMDQLALAQGDFARTSDSWANQTRILSMQWQEFMSVVGQALITVLRPLVVTLNSVVASMIDVANTVNSVVTTLFGGTSTQMQQTQQDADGVGDSIAGSVEDQDNLTDAVKDTNKESKKSLANFDEINKLAGDVASSVITPVEPPTPDGGATAGGKEVEGLSEKMKSMLESLKSGFEELKGWVTDFFKPLKESWAAHGETVITSAKNACSEIIGLLRSIGTTFMNAWSNGTGVRILNTIHSIVSNILKVVSALADRIRIAWEASGNGEAIWQSLMNIIQMALNFVDRIAAATVTWAQGLDLEPIVSSFRGLMEAIEPLVNILLDGLAWAYENILLPFGKWTIEEVAPAAIDLLTAAIDALTSVIEALKPFALWLWETFLKPLAEWTGEVVINSIKWLTEKLREFSDWARENPEAIQEIGKVIFSFLAGILAYQAVHKIADVIGKIKAAFVGLASGFNIANIQAGLAAIAFGAIIWAVMELVNNWDKLSGLQKVVAVLGAIGAAALAAAIAVGAFQSALTLGLAVVGIVAGIVAITSAINSAKSSAESMSRSGGSFSAGGGGFGGGAYALSAANIPHLARGAVIPPNREFLAVLGDQKSGTNIEAPASEIEAAVDRALDRRGGSGNEMRLVVSYRNGAQRYLKVDLDEETKRRGVSLVKG